MVDSNRIQYRIDAWNQEGEVSRPRGGFERVLLRVQVEEWNAVAWNTRRFAMHRLSTLWWSVHGAWARGMCALATTLHAWICKQAGEASSQKPSAHLPSFVALGVSLVSPLGQHWSKISIPCRERIDAFDSCPTTRSSSPPVPWVRFDGFFGFDGELNPTRFLLESGSMGGDRPTTMATTCMAACARPVRTPGSVQVRRRDVMKLSVGSCALLWVPGARAAPVFDLERGMSRFIRRKPRDPLDSYVVPLLLCVEQLELLAEFVQKDHERLVLGRAQLREGPFATLRDDLRAVAEFGQANGREDVADLVDVALRAVDRADSTLLRDIRKVPEGGASSEAVDAILQGRDKVNQVLDTVPEDVLAKSKEVVTVLKEAGDEVDGPDANESVEYQELEKIL